ncbi:transcription factor TFIIIB component B'' homolog isoform X2 [Nerophis ophidion]|uniref:transcription factor TFIIIB component B'' homolog isoform X2 n=1 Tax=Nerophis ophidion TaxID=159077 RepID=UPI002ADF34D0|nr:transcription factor TFIIIB component B'' homolog isoform X2 [Nerophis ophidion]
MFRRSRFSVRPNVGGPGRTGAAPQEATPGGKEVSQAPKAISEGAPLPTVDDNKPVPTVDDNKPVDTPVAAPIALGDGNEPSGEASSAAVQRRKRFSVKPRVAPGRPSIVPRVPKSPAKLVPESPAKVSELGSTTSNEAKSPAATPLTPSSPTPTPDSKLPHVQPTLAPPEGCADALKEVPPLPDLGKQAEKSPNSSIKVPHRPLDKVSLPDREAAELSEKAKTLLSSKTKKSIARFSLSRLLNDPSDIQRLENAQKLRDLLRQEMRKEKGIKKRKKPIKEFSVDPTKMTMRDLIRYLPLSNPMSSSLEDDTEQNETVTPFTPRMEILPERAQEPEPEPEAEVVPAAVNQTEEEAEDVEGTGQGDEEDDALMVPQVKVAEDGTLILDEESLTVEVQRAKGPNPAEDRDPIFERGSTTTYSSFRASTYCKPWSSEETDMFFLAISMVGTDFSMICQLFHNRTRSEIRNKFKKEEKQNSWRVDKAFRERRKLDIEYFSKLLEKILEVQQNRKKLKSLVVKNPPKKSQGKSKGRKRKKAAGKLSASEEEDEVEEDSLLCSEAEDGEKENEGGTLSSKAKKKLKSKVDASAAKPAKKKSKTSEKSSKEGEDEACVPEDTEVALPEDHADSEVCESAVTEKTSNGATVTPAKLPRGKCSKKLPLSPTAAAEDGDRESAEPDESVKDDASKDQVNKEALPSREASDNDVDDSCSDEDSGDEDYSVKPAKPTRSGRIPKPTTLLSYPAPSTRTAPKRDRTTKASSAAPSSKKPKLVMLRATQSESSAEEDGQELEDEEMKELWSDGSTQAFVPASLRSPHPVICQVEEAVEEDVIDLLSSEHAGVSEVESYNEAAQTLLAIGNVSHLSHSDTTQGLPSDSGNETSRRLEEEIVAEFIEENTSTPIISVPLDQEETDAFETAPVGPRNTESSPHVGVETCCELRHVSDHDLTRPLQSNTPTRIARSSKVKPKPNLAKASRAAHSKTQPETSSQGSIMVSDSVAPDLLKDPSEEPSSKIAKCSQSSEKQTFDMDAMSTDAETSESAASDAAVTETLAQESGSDYVALPVVHEDQNSSKPPSSRPTRTTTSKVEEPQPTCTFSPKKISPSVNSFSSATTTLSLSSNLVEELASSEIAKWSQFSKKQNFEMDAKFSNAETSESAASETAVTETLAQESGSDYVAIPVVHEDQNSSEHLSSGPTRTTTSKVEPQPTCTSSPKKISPDANFSSSETTIMSLRSNLVEELASSATKNTCTRLDNQLSSESKPTDAEKKKVDCSPNEAAAFDDAVTEPLTQESNMHLIQKGEDNGAMIEVHEGQTSREHNSSPPFKRNRFHRVKPKPNLSQISKSARSKPQTTKETSDSSKLESTSAPTSTVKPQPTCTFSPTKTNPSANSASSVTTAMDVCPNLLPPEELTSGEIVTSTENDKQLSIEEIATDAEHIEFGSNEDAAADDAVAEPLAQESSMSLIQKGGFNDNVPEAHEGQDSSELQSSPHFRRNRFHRVKPKPNLSQISKSARSKPQATKETSDSSKLESTSAPTSMVKPQPTCTFSSEKKSQCTDSASSVLTTMNPSSNLVPTEELTFSEIETSTGCDDQLSSEPKSTDAEKIEYGANKEAASDDTVTEPLAQKSSMPLIQKGGFEDEMPEVHEGQNSRELHSSPLLKRNRFQRVKPKPNLTQISKRKLSEPQVNEETSQSSKLESTGTTTSKVEPQPTCIFSPEKTGQSADSASFVTTTMNLSSDQVSTEELASSAMKNTGTRLANQLSSEPKTMNAEKKKVECSPNKDAASDDAVTEQLAQESSMPLVQECEINDSMLEVHEGQNSSEVQSSQPFRRNRFHRFKPKPNLSHISKGARSKPQAPNETSQSSKLESTSTTTITSLAEEATASADSASFVTTAMNFSPIQVSKEELSSSEVNTSTRLSNQLSSEPKPTDGENIEFGPHKAAASGDAVTELLAQESKTCSIQESRGHDALPEVYACQSLSEPSQLQPTKRNRFQRVKPKPNLSQISKSARSKPQSTKETIMSTNLECTGKITTEVEPQPTCTFSPEKPSPKESALIPSMDSSTSLVPRAELTSSQEKKAVELAHQEESSLPVVDASKENTGVKEAIFGAANETVRFDAEVTQSSSNNVVPSDTTLDCPGGVGANANQSTIHKVSNHLEKVSKSDLKCESSDDRSVEAESPATSEMSQSVTSPLEICLAYQPTEDLSSSSDKNKEADSGTSQRRQCLPKVKPALRFPARAIRSTSQSKDGGESFSRTSECHVVEKKSAGPRFEIDEKVVMETEEKSNEEVYKAPCQDKKEDINYLKSDDQNIAAAPSNTQLLCQDTVPEHSKTLQTNKMMTETQPLQKANEPPLPKTTTTRRSRLVKPKPNLGKSGRQARQVAAKADSDAVRAPASQEILPEPVKPVEGAIGPSAMECTTQGESTSSTGQEQTFASLSILQDALSVPSDPDEPFFILSLTEIPVDAVEEVLNPSAQLPPFICDPNQSVQQSLAVENVRAGPDGSTPDVLVSAEETATTMTPAIVDPLAPPERHQACASAGPSSTASSPKRKPKGFLSFLTSTPSVAASRRSRRKKPTPAPRTTTTHPPVESHLAAAELSSAPQPHANDDALVASSQVSACEHDDGEAVQPEPSDVSQFFLSDIFTEV